MILDRPLLGAGLNNFTYHLENYVNRPEIIRFVQPAHHFIILWAAETGFLGVLLLFTIIYKLSQNCHQNQLANALLILSPLLALDHYLLTITTGRYSLGLILGLCLVEKSKGLLSQLLNQAKKFAKSKSKLNFLFGKKLKKQAA